MQRIVGPNNRFSASSEPGDFIFQTGIDARDYLNQPISPALELMM